jgi:acyl-CoA synthetase (AMP-forming)/AMP-acid ligase II
MANVGVGSWIERRARTAPARVALIHGDRSWTYAELASRIRRLAAGLRSLGVQRGDRVGWIGPNHPAFLEGLFAAGTLAVVLAPINHRLDEEAVGGILKDADPAVVLVHQSMADLPALSSRKRVVVDGADAPSNDLLYETLLADSPDDPIEEPVGFDHLCMLPFTSGTTGTPKGVMLTHGNVTWNVVNLLSVADFSGQDVTVAIAPFFRVGGTGVNVLPVLFKGGTVVVPESPDPDEILRLTEQHWVTVGFGNPDLLAALAASPRWPSADLSSVRFVITGGAPVPERLIRTFLDRRVTLLQGYGLSEAAPVVLLLDPADALTKGGAAGRPPPLVDVRIVGPEGSEVEPGDTGELLVRGPNVMAGYWRHPEATRATIDEDGWLRTGDAARMDADGDIWIVDRVVEAYVTADRVVYPANVERALLSHDAVADAGVVGIPRGDHHVGAAFVVVARGSEVTEADLLAHCRSHLAEHEVPVSVSFVDELPRNSVGKLLRHQLAAPAEQR